MIKQKIVTILFLLVSSCSSNVYPECSELDDRDISEFLKEVAIQELIRISAKDNIFMVEDVKFLHEDILKIDKMDLVQKNTAKIVDRKLYAEAYLLKLNEKSLDISIMVGKKNCAANLTYSLSR